VICPPCRSAGALRISDPESARLLHFQCRGGTWCDCAHSLDDVLNHSFSILSAIPVIADARMPSGVGVLVSEPIVITRDDLLTVWRNQNPGKCSCPFGALDPACPQHSTERTRRCPSCLGTNITTEGKVESDLAILGEDEYVQECHDCGAEWVRNVTATRIKILRRGIDKLDESG
jgi:hypothetical protein